MDAVLWCKYGFSSSQCRGLCCVIALGCGLGLVESVTGRSRRLARSEQDPLEVSLFARDVQDVNTAALLEKKPEAAQSPTHLPLITSCGVEDNAKFRDYVVSEEQMRRGETSSAGAFRLHSFYEKLKNGSDVSIAVIGGPVEFGAHCADCSSAALWHDYIRKWLTKTFSRPSRPPAVHIIDRRNKTKLSSAFDFRGETWAEALGDYDLVIVAGIGSHYPLQGKGAEENAAKGIDVNRHYAEWLLRELLQAPKSPAVLIVAWLNDYWWDAEDTADMLRHNGLAYRFGTLQDEAYEFLAMYYEISMMSARNALLHSTFVSSASDNIAPGWNHSDILTNRLYPTAAGHYIFGQLATNFLCKQLAIAQEFKAPETTKRQHTLSPAVFANPKKFATLRRGMDFSGFPGSLDDSLDASGGLNASIGVNTGGAASFSLELQSAVASLAVLEVVCLASQGPTGSVLGFLFSDAAPVWRRQLHISALEPLRFVAAAQVVLFHEAIHRTDTYFKRFAACGQYWMQLFFILSGFTLYLAQDNVQEILDPPRLLSKQLADWYPVYLMGIILTLSADGNPLHAAIRYASENFLPGFLMAEGWAYPYGSDSPNGQIWFLSSLVFFWLCFPHWYTTVRALRTPWMAVLLAYFSTLIAPMVCLIQHFGMLRGTVELFPHASRFLECHPFANWQAFIFGMGLARVASESQLEFLPAMIRQRAASTSLALLFAFPILLPWPAEPVLNLFMQQGVFLLPFFGVVLIFATLGEDRMLTPCLLDSSRALWLGRISRPFLVLYEPLRMWTSSYFIDLSVPSLLIIQFWAIWACHLAEQLIMSSGGSGGKAAVEQATSKT